MRIPQMDTKTQPMALFFRWGPTPLGSIQERNRSNENTNDGDGMENNETHRKQNDANVNKEKERPWKIVIQNMEGLKLERSKEKV